MSPEYPHDLREAGQHYLKGWDDWHMVENLLLKQCKGAGPRKYCFERSHSSWQQCLSSGSLSCHPLRVLSPLKPTFPLQGLFCLWAEPTHKALEPTQLPLYLRPPWLLELVFVFLSNTGAIRLISMKLNVSHFIGEELMYTERCVWWSKCWMTVPSIHCIS